MAVIDNLRMNREALEEAIDNFEVRKIALENAYLKINNEVNELEDTWSGQASLSFQNQFQNLYNNIKQSETVMTTVVTKVKATLAKYEEQEAKAKALVDALDEGKIYQALL